MSNDNSAQCWVGSYREGTVELMICPPKPGLILGLSIWEKSTPAPARMWRLISQASPSHPLTPHYQSLTVAPNCALCTFQNCVPLSIFTAVVSTSSVVSCLYHCSAPTGSTPNPGAPAMRSTQCSRSDHLEENLITPPFTLPVAPFPSHAPPRSYKQNLNVSLLLESRQTPEHILQSPDTLPFSLSPDSY